MATPGASDGKARPQTAQTPAVRDAGAGAGSGDVRERLQNVEQLQAAGKADEAVIEMLAVAAMYTSRNAPVKAVAVLRQAVRLKPESPDVRIAYGEVLHQLRMVEDASREYATACGWLEQAGRYSEWLEVLRRLLAMDPDNLVGRLQLAEALSRAGKFQDATDAFRSLSELLLERGETEDWEKVAERLLYHAPGDNTTAHDLALHYVRSGRHAEALSKLILCYDAVPGDAELLELIIDTLESLGQREKAAVICKELIRTFRRTGLSDDADKALERLHALDPDDDEARAYMGVLRPTMAIDTVIELEAGGGRRDTGGHAAAQRPTPRAAEKARRPDSGAFDDFGEAPTSHVAQLVRPVYVPTEARPPVVAAAQPRPPAAPAPAARPAAEPQRPQPQRLEPQRPEPQRPGPQPRAPAVPARPGADPYQPVAPPRLSPETLASHSAIPVSNAAPVASRLPSTTTAAIAPARPPTLPATPVAAAATPVRLAAMTAPTADPQTQPVPAREAQAPRATAPRTRPVSNGYRPSAPLPALEALASSYDDAADAGMQAWPEDDEPCFEFEERTLEQLPTLGGKRDAPTLELGGDRTLPEQPMPGMTMPEQTMPRLVQDVPKPAQPAPARPQPPVVSLGIPAGGLGPDDATGGPVASARRRSNSLPRPRLARNVGTMSELPSTLRDMSKDMGTLDFFIERGFYESAVALLDALQKRHPESAELRAYRQRIERMPRG